MRRTRLHRPRTEKFSSSRTNQNIDAFNYLAGPHQHAKKNLAIIAHAAGLKIQTLANRTLPLFSMKDVVLFAAGLLFVAGCNFGVDGTGGGYDPRQELKDAYRSNMGLD